MIDLLRATSDLPRAKCYFVPPLVLAVFDISA